MTTAANMIRGTSFGAISIILNVLDEHINNPKVFKRGCNVLEIFVKDEDDGIYSSNTLNMFYFCW